MKSIILILFSYLLSIFVFPFKKQFQNMNLEKQFDALFLNNEEINLLDLYNHQIKMIEDPGPGLGLRQLLYLISRDNSKNEVVNLGRKLLKKHPGMKLTNLSKLSKQLGFSDLGKIDQFITEIELAFMQDIFGGGIPKTSAPVFLQPFVDDTFFNIVVGEKFIEQNTPLQKILYLKPSGAGVKISCNIENQHGPKKESGFSCELINEDRFKARIEVDTFSSHIQTNQTNLISAFDMGIPEVNAYMSSIDSNVIARMLNWKLMYQDEILKSELLRLLHGKYLNVLYGIVVYLENCGIKDKIDTLEIYFHDHMPVIWREKATTEKLLSPYKEHHFLVHMTRFQVAGKLDYTISKEVISNKNLNKIFASLKKDIPYHLSLSVAENSPY